MKLRWKSIAAGLLLLLSAGSETVSAAPSERSTVRKRPGFRRVLIVVFENTDFDEAMRQPDFAKLANEGALLTGFHAEAHPSQPNYLAMTSGDTHGVKSNHSVDLDVKNIADLLEARHKSWKAYLEDYPGGCFAGDDKDNYVRKHNPFISFTEIQKSPERCAHLVPAPSLREDVLSGKLPDFSYYVPNLKNDGHDTGVDFAGGWLARTFLPMLQGKGGSLPKDLLLVVTFDENKSGGPENRIYTALVGGGAKPGARSDQAYDHYSLLRTIENQFHLGTLGKNDEKAVAIEDVWK